MERIVIGMAGKNIAIYDIRAGKIEDERLSPLSHPTRCLACMPDGNGYVIGSTEGRVGVEYFPGKSEKGYKFKCHRDTTDTENLIYPLNSICYHPIYGTFATGGSDGTVCTWDGVGKKRISASNYQAVQSLAYNRDGTLLAIGCGYGYEDDDVPM
jgi:cell cycle arrest protein BUB3